MGRVWSLGQNPWEGPGHFPPPPPPSPSPSSLGSLLSVVALKKWWVAEMSHCLVSLLLSLFYTSALLAPSPPSPPPPPPQLHSPDWNVYRSEHRCLDTWHPKLKFSHFSSPEGFSIRNLGLLHQELTNKSAKDGGFKLSSNFGCTQWPLYNVIYSHMSEMSSCTLLANEVIKPYCSTWGQHCCKICGVYMDSPKLRPVATWTTISSKQRSKVLEAEAK